MQTLPAAPVRWVAPVMALWLVLTPVYAPASQSHALVTRLALVLSGQSRPHTRDMLKAVLATQAVASPAGAAVTVWRPR
jgi:hypothetical protein